MSAETFNAIRAEIAEEYLSTAQAYPWIVAFSAGKDSTLLLHLVVEALLDLAPSERRRPVHILFNDTLVESPIYAEHADATLTRLEAALPALSLPCVVHRATPDPNQTFWVNLIGRGYASPNTRFRWCTDRLKIAPTNRYIKSQVAEHDRVILLLGVRKEESATRKKSISQHESTEGGRLGKHSISGCLSFRPIVDVTAEELWAFLLQRPPPWGGSHRNLITLYRNMSGGECPLVLDQSEAPACGASGSLRFGCWTCTVVTRDRSMEAQIDAGEEWMEPLVQLRGHLRTIRNDKSCRMDHRRNGKPGLGSFTFETREDLLRRLLEAQDEVGRPLISNDEIRRIRQIWAEDIDQEARRALGLG